MKRYTVYCNGDEFVATVLEGKETFPSVSTMASIAVFDFNYGKDCMFNLNDKLGGIDIKDIYDSCNLDKSTLYLGLYDDSSCKIWIKPYSINNLTDLLSSLVEASVYDLAEAYDYCLPVCDAIVHPYQADSENNSKEVKEVKESSSDFDLFNAF